MSTKPNHKLARGQIYVCNLGANPGSLQSFRRPVLIVSSDSICRTSTTITVIPITSVIKRLDLPWHVMLPNNVGLIRPSMLLAEQTTTIMASQLEYCCGCVSEINDLDRINDCLKKALGLYHKKSFHYRDFSPSKTTTCLCYKCIDYYRNNPAYLIKRLTPNNGNKDKCDRCGINLGFEYQISTKGEN